VTPEEIIAQLKSAKANETGRLVLSTPITNIPVSLTDFQAAKVLDFMWSEVLGDTNTLQDALNVIAEVQWWLVFFAAFKDEDGFEPMNGGEPKR
jgi:hypothetical protein